jgi:hypothetical protein
MNSAEFKRRIALYTYRILHWGQNHVPPGVRSVIGVVFMVAGVLGFLPILGFWMLPLGMAFVAMDVPPARRRIDIWMERLHRQSQLNRPQPDLNS